MLPLLGTSWGRCYEQWRSLLGVSNLPSLWAHSPQQAELGGCTGCSSPVSLIPAGSKAPVASSSRMLGGGGGEPACSSGDGLNCSLHLKLTTASELAARLLRISMQSGSVRYSTCHSKTPKFPLCMHITSHATIVLPPVTLQTPAESHMCVLVFKERPGQCYFGVSFTLAFAPLPLSPLFVFIFASEQTKTPTCHCHRRATENVT